MRILSFYIWVFCLLISPRLYGQNAGFFLEADRYSVEEGETFQLIIRLENLEANRVELGDIAPFNLLGGPSVSTSYSNINGRSSSAKSYSYLLQAVKKGTFVIAPATAMMAGKVIKTNEIKIKVTEPKVTQWSQESDENSFVRMELSANEGYPGQVIQLDYVLYTRQNVERYDISQVEYPDAFYVENVRNHREQPQKKIIQGKEFLRAVLRRDRLYVLKTGKYELGPATISLEIPVENGRSSFFFRETRTEILTAPASEIQIFELPAPVPGSFAGAVGQFSMSASVKKATVVTGEAIVVNIDVEGTGDPKMVKAPIQNWPSFLENYPPTVVNDEVMERGGQAVMKKSFEYFVVCPKDTVFTFVPEMTYFDPEEKKYLTLKADTITIVVLNGVPKNTELENNRYWEPELSHKETLTSVDTVFWTPTNFIYVFSGIVLFTFMGVFLKKRQMEKSLEKAERAKSPDSKALKSLRLAAEHMKNGHSYQFFDEIARATTGFLTDYLNISPSETQVSKMTEYMETRGIPEEIIQLYKNIHHQSELARFAGMSTFSMEDVYRNAEKFLFYFNQKT